MDINFIIDTCSKIIFNGLPISLLLVLLTLCISLPIGFVLGIIRYKRIKILNNILVVIMSFFKGVPLIILIFLFYNAMPSFLNKIATEMGMNINFFEINVVYMAVFICSTFEIAACAEIFRSAIASVGEKQMEAALCCNLSPVQAYIHIIIPQSIVSALPNLSNEIVSLVKGTSLLFYMGIQDIMGVAKASAGNGYQYVEAYFSVLIVYVILCFLIQKGMLYLEKYFGKFRGAM